MCQMPHSSCVTSYFWRQKIKRDGFSPSSWGLIKAFQGSLTILHVQLHFLPLYSTFLLHIIFYVLLCYKNVILRKNLNSLWCSGCYKHVWIKAKLPTHQSDAQYYIYKWLLTNLQFHKIEKRHQKSRIMFKTWNLHQHGNLVTVLLTA